MRADARRSFPARAGPLQSPALLRALCSTMSAVGTSTVSKQSHKKSARAPRHVYSTQACNHFLQDAACLPKVSAAVSFRRASELVHSSCSPDSRNPLTWHCENCQSPISSALSGRASDPADVYSFRAQQDQIPGCLRPAIRARMEAWTRCTASLKSQFACHVLRPGRFRAVGRRGSSST